MNSAIQNTIKEKYKNKEERKKPRILVVTPEIPNLPREMGNMANVLSAKVGGMADTTGSLVSELYDLNFDVHVALPHYRRMFHSVREQFIGNDLRLFDEKLPGNRVHLAEDRIFYYRDSIYQDYEEEAANISLAFQREVINNIIPMVKPDVIHCNDWMTGLIPAMARRRGIPCLFTFHNLYTQKLLPSHIEERGIDLPEFWQYLYYQYPPGDNIEGIEGNAVDLITSGIFASDSVNTVNPGFLKNLTDRQYDFIPDPICKEITNKVNSGFATGIMNAPDRIYHPESNLNLIYNYSYTEPLIWKMGNKIELQRKLDLTEDKNAPLLFWPSRLDPVLKGCDLMAHILYHVISKHWEKNLQIVFAANGSYQQTFKDIVQSHDFFDRVAVCDFNEKLTHQAYAGSDFVLMPSKFEPCGLPQMIGSIFGSLPIAFNTGGLQNIVDPVKIEENTGNGFLFESFDETGLSWAIDKAIQFYFQPADIKERQISRIMKEALQKFNLEKTTRAYVKLYEKVLQKSFIGSYQ